MADPEVLERLDRLHEENKHKQIIWEIARLPKEVQQGYDIQSRKGRALGNLGEHSRAYRVLEPLREEGKEDPLWWYRIGCCFFCMERDEEARQAFTRAMELGDEGDDCRRMLALMDERERSRQDASKALTMKGKKW